RAVHDNFNGSDNNRHKTKQKRDPFAMRSSLGAASLNLVFPFLLMRRQFHLIIFIIFILYLSRRTSAPFYSENAGLSLNYLESIHLNCEPIIEDTEDIVKYRHWKYDFKDYEYELYKSSNICETINKYFYFEREPLSKEEEEYPLAFGFVLYKDIVQVLLELSIFYYPQNTYCITVDGTANRTFKKVIMHLPKCFKNIKTFIGKRSQWGSYGILDNVYQCFNYLAHSDHNWKYYQYLSGSDLPLRTNLEMVRIMKALNGSINSDIDEFETDRYRTMEGIHPPLPLYKSAMSVAMPRAAANYIVRSEKVKRLLRYLSNTWIPDESFWTSVAGNAPLLRVPGSFRARDIIWLRKHLNANLPWEWTTSSIGTTYIGRYQVWEWQKVCMGQIRAWSCVFGVMDIPSVIKRPELIVHKLDLTFEPAAYLCLMKEIRYRSYNPLEFDATSYSEMPTVETVQRQKNYRTYSS
uniref:Protein xylosyltransferase n=1 Tax=Haemonchus contortus TaxID=6289 RepID=A0A7I4Z5A7_HAECO